MPPYPPWLNITVYHLRVEQREHERALSLLVCALWVELSKVVFTPPSHTPDLQQTTDLVLEVLKECERIVLELKQEMETRSDETSASDTEDQQDPPELNPTEEKE